MVSCAISDAAYATNVQFVYSSGGSLASIAALLNGNTATATLSSLSAATTYTVYVTATATNGTPLQSSSANFTTATPQTTHAAWYELPAQRNEGSQMWTQTYYAGSDRNYTLNYDKSTYTAYWVAYPLAQGHFGGSRAGSWARNPDLSTDYQINIWSSSYGVNLGSTTSDGYVSSKEFYARGHQIPDGDRSGISAMQNQTYYATNSTPQIQNAFNGGIWQFLEKAVRDAVPAQDTIYVVTGATLRTVGGNETVTYILPKNESVKKCPVPNYYYKVLLKVERSADGKQIIDAEAIGFWLPHMELKGASYESYTTSVADIEQKTGYDFFVNLPADIRLRIRQNSSWTAFQSF